MNLDNMIQGNPQALVKSVNGIMVADSLQVADCFGKAHKNVLQTIDNLVTNLAAENSATNAEPEDYFIPAEYQNRGKTYKKYLLTRDGFSLLVMGFTGPAALHWKLLYIEAFNKMEKALKESSDLQLLVSQITKDVLRNVLPQITQASQKTATEVTEEQAPRRNQRIYTLYGNEEALPNFLTVYDIRDFLGIGQRQAYELVRSEGFPKKKIGQNYRVLKQDFLSWLHTNEYNH